MICPTDKDLFFFAHEGNTEYISNRLWLYDHKSKTMRNIAKQSLNENGDISECYGHEAWSHNGEGLYFVKYDSNGCSIYEISSNKAEEFVKANIVVKAVRIEENCTIEQHILMPAFEFNELLREEWGILLAETEDLLYQEKETYYKTKSEFRNYLKNQTDSYHSGRKIRFFCKSKNYFSG